MTRQPEISRELIAHGLAMAYINNRHGAEVSGEVDVSSVTDTDGDLESVSGSGWVATERLPDVSTRKTVRVPTGERHLFGLGPMKMKDEPTDEYAVDEIFISMIHDYYAAYERFLALLQNSRS